MLPVMGWHRTASGRMVAVAAAALLLGSTARGENSYLTRARAAYEQLDYDKVTPLLEQALAQSNTVDDEVAIYELLGLIHVTYGRDQEAQNAFVELLKRQPEFQLPGESSPKIVSVFEQAKSELARRQPSETPRRGNADSRPPTRTVPAPPVQPSRATDLPDADPDQRAASGRIEASDDGGAFYGQWWFWTGAIAAVGVSSVVAGVLIWFLTRPRVPETDFGPYPLK